MRKIVVMLSVSLDGFIEGPTPRQLPRMTNSWIAAWTTIDGSGLPVATTAAVPTPTRRDRNTWNPKPR